MWDKWEEENGLNSDDPEDRNGDRNSDGYTNLEEYLDAVISMSPVSAMSRSADMKPAIRCYPNPASGEFLIDLSGFGKSTIEIISTTGQLLYSETGTCGVQQIGVHKLVPGIYQVQVSDDNGNNYSQKIIFQ